MACVSAAAFTSSGMVGFEHDRSGLQALCLRQSGFKYSKEARRFASSHDAMVESQ
jgi:hypothetical protein